jgi:hypothetical protein
MKNKIAKANIWRVAVQINNVLFFDIDGDNFNNVKFIKSCYTKILKQEFKTIKTYNGYHLHSKRYEDSLLWQYDTCKVLNPLLERENLQKYIEAINTFYKNEILKQKVNGYTKEEFITQLAIDLRDSGLYFGYGEFDIVFAINVILKGFYCIRISKKGIDDKPYEINL